MGFGQTFFRCQIVGGGGQATWPSMIFMCVEVLWVKVQVSLLSFHNVCPQTQKPKLMFEHDYHP